MYKGTDDPDIQLPEQDDQDHETVEQRLQEKKIVIRNRHGTKEAYGYHHDTRPTTCS